MLVLPATKEFKMLIRSILSEFTITEGVSELGFTFKAERMLDRIKSLATTPDTFCLKSIATSIKTNSYVFVLNPTIRTATKRDFAVGSKLIMKSEGWEFVIKEHVQDGIWASGQKALFECEAEGYLVESYEL